MLDLMLVLIVIALIGFCGIVGWMLWLALFYHVEAKATVRVVLKESEIRRVLIWYYSMNIEQMARDEDDKLAENLRKIYNLSDDVQTYPEWDE